MKLCRFQSPDGRVGAGLVATDGQILDLAPVAESFSEILERPDWRRRLDGLKPAELPRVRSSEVTLLAPVENQEIWAAGVTYLRSKTARMEESDFSATAYGKVYDAARPELFFKSLPQKVSGPARVIGIRADSKWNVPEPELALVLNSRGELAGYTIGNDMSSRDIEGENLLYLPQAKIYRHSCALGPFITTGVSEEEARAWTISLEIQRGGSVIFRGETSVSKIKRGFKELAEYLFRSQSFPDGAVLLTGTGVVPPDHFTLEAKDHVRITITGIGTLENVVETV